MNAHQQYWILVIHITWHKILCVNENRTKAGHVKIRKRQFTKENNDEFNCVLQNE
jgi:hypothetical protein